MKELELTENYYRIVRSDNSTPAKSLNVEEWLLIVREVIDKCGKFLEDAFEKNSGSWQIGLKPLSQYVFDFYLPKSATERRMPHADLSKNFGCYPFLLSFDTLCVLGEKIKRKNVKKTSFETWLLLTLEGKMLLIELELCKQAREKKQPHGFDEIVTRASFYLDVCKNDQNLFEKKLLPYMNFKLAERIIDCGLDVLNFDKHRREEEQEEFARAFEFRRMVLARIQFPV